MKKTPPISTDTPDSVRADISQHIIPVLEGASDTSPKIVEALKHCLPFAPGLRPGKDIGPIVL
jgi:hypothetical protein